MSGHDPTTNLSSGQSSVRKRSDLNHRTTRTMAHWDKESQPEVLQQQYIFGEKKHSGEIQAGQTGKLFGRSDWACGVHDTTANASVRAIRAAGSEATTA